jgi:hypothetical protein
MCSPGFYRQQAHRCLMLSRATTDPRIRLWLTDLANNYVKKADAAVSRIAGPFPIPLPTDAAVVRQ